MSLTSVCFADVDVIEIRATWDVVPFSVSVEDFDAFLVLRIVRFAFLPKSESVERSVVRPGISS
jgi:hypothetical protein